MAFSVEDAVGIYNKAVSRGAVSVWEPKTESDEHGTVVTAAIKTYGDTVHILVDRTQYKGVFLPGYRAPTVVDPLAESLYVPPVVRSRGWLIEWNAGGCGCSNLEAFAPV